MNTLLDKVKAVVNFFKTYLRIIFEDIQMPLSRFLSMLRKPRL